MISRVTVKNFKGLADFQLPAWTSSEYQEFEHSPRLGPLVVLVGPNGAGKTTILQALGFLGQMVKGSLRRWVEEREWSVADLHSRVISSPEMRFTVELTTDFGRFLWQGQLHYDTLRCTHETIKSDEGKILLFHSGGECQVEGKGYDFSAVDFEGSILSVLKTDSLSERLRAVKNLLSEIGLLDQLSPEKLRRGSGRSSSLGLGGEGLAGYLAHLPSNERELIEADLIRFFPEVENVSTRLGVDGSSSELLLKERAATGEISSFVSSALHSSDGRLRVLTLIAQSYSLRSLVLLDEIENGIYPGLAEKLIDYLLARSHQSGKQFWITTHNPLILNYLPDEVAIQSIYLVRRGQLAETYATAVYGPWRGVFGHPIRAEVIEKVIVSGEGRGDLGQQYAGGMPVYGPIAVLLQQLGVPLAPDAEWRFYTKDELIRSSRIQLPGKKRLPGKAFFHSNALGLARIASREAGKSIAVLFRDADTTQATSRQIWNEKWDSIRSGFEEGGFDLWVGLLPAPKSEAWLLCALKEPPFQYCEALESRSGNDASPSSLKKALAEAAERRGLGGDSSSLVTWLRESCPDAARSISMNSWNKARERVEGTRVS